MNPRFRGLTVKGRWVTGFVSVVKNAEIGVVPGTYISNKFGLPFAYEVRPETVGQYTGLKDKNGVEIYEGDIVKTRIYKDDCTGLVEFSNVLALWYMTGMSRSDTELWLCNDKEVIGNIYENPELLEKS